MDSRSTAKALELSLKHLEHLSNLEKIKKRRPFCKEKKGLPCISRIEAARKHTNEAVEAENR
jgi:hypothetical protein